MLFLVCYGSSIDQEMVLTAENLGTPMRKEVGMIKCC